LLGSRNYPNFMKLEDSLPRSQQPATRPYLTPTESTPHSYIKFLKDSFRITLPSHKAAPYTVSLSYRTKIDSVVHPMGIGVLPRRSNGRDVKLTTHTHLMPRSKCAELYFHSPSTSSWRGALIGPT